jgi:hypothetical protein
MEDIAEGTGAGKSFMENGGTYETTGIFTPEDPEKQN